MEKNFFNSKTGNSPERSDRKYDLYCEQKSVLDAYTANKSDKYLYPISYFIAVIFKNRICIIRRAKGRVSSPLYLVISILKKPSGEKADFYVYTSKDEAAKRIKNSAKYKDFYLYEMSSMDNRKFITIKINNCPMKIYQLLFLCNVLPDISENLYIPLKSFKSKWLAWLLLP